MLHPGAVLLTAVLMVQLQQALTEKSQILAVFTQHGNI